MSLHAYEDARELGASSTVHDRFQEGEKADFFKARWQAGLEVYSAEGLNRRNIKTASFLGPF